MRNLSTSPCSFALLLACLCAPACSSENGALFAPLPDDGLVRQPGRASFAIVSNGLELSIVRYSVRRGEVEVLSGEVTPPAPGAAIDFTLELPAAEGYVITMSAETRAGRSCKGESGLFDVLAGQLVDVGLSLACERAPASEGQGQVHVTADLVSVPPVAGACDGLGSACHAVDGGSGPAQECHELGHAGDAAACAERRAECIDVCGTAQCAALSSLCHDVDPGSGPLHDCHELGHSGDAAACFARGAECQKLCAEARAQPLEIRFEARLGDATFACGQSVAGAGTPPAPAQPRDFRVFVHDVVLLTAGGGRVPVQLDTRAPFQALGVALLDFEDGSGRCTSGDTATNTTLTGMAPPGDYTGLEFAIGVPASVNHADPTQQPSPLGPGNMSWGWLAGYKFLRAELESAAGSTALHLGSTGCSGDASQGTVTCQRGNRPRVVLDGFSPATDHVIADLAALFAGSDLAVTNLCRSVGASCALPFAQLGLDLAAGQSTGTQSVFRVGR